MKKIVLAVSSSISAYKANDLARLFIKGGYDVHACVTDHATKLVSPLTLEALTGNPVYSNETLWEKRQMGHIALKEGASLFLAAPATANLIAKFAHGIADDLVSTTFLAMSCPVMVAPAMNPNMFAHPAVQENIMKLKGWGIHIVEPDEGLAACGDQGKGRLADINTIYEAACGVIKGK